MIPFITFREEDEYGRLCFYILQKAHPHYIGLLVTSPKEGSLINMPLPEYNLWITFSGVLIGNYVPSFVGMEVEMDAVFANMAEWYYLNRIKTNPKKYAKFKLTT